MLEKSLRLTFQTMLAIYKSGFTRVPVFEGSRQNIVAVMYAKDLILVDPDDSIQVGTVLSFRCEQTIYCAGFGICLRNELFSDGYHAWHWARTKVSAQIGRCANEGEGAVSMAHKNFFPRAF